MASSEDKEHEQMAENGHGERRAHPGDSRTIVALSERVAIIETQQHALKEDTGTIRRNSFSNSLPG